MPAARIFTLLIVVILFTQCGKDSNGPVPQTQKPMVPVNAVFDPAADLNIFFVGNSLTYFNDLPAIVKEIALMDGVKISYTTIANPDYSFDDHLEDGAIPAVLKAHQYDYLIGQQGPSALPESQVLLKASSKKIANECHAHNTKFGLYMVWPSLDREFDRDNSIASYTNAAEEADALLCPAGLAWKRAWTKDPSLPLYGPDNFHPSFHGSVLAAIVIYASIREKKNLDFIELSKSTWTGKITEAQLVIMKTSTIEAIKTK